MRGSGHRSDLLISPIRPNNLNFRYTMRLVSKYFWLQRWKSKREMAKSFYKQFDIQVNKKCLLALLPNTTETQIRAGI